MFLGIILGIALFPLIFGLFLEYRFIIKSMIKYRDNYLVSLPENRSKSIKYYLLSGVIVLISLILLIFFLIFAILPGLPLLIFSNTWRNYIMIKPD